MMMKFLLKSKFDALTRAQLPISPFSRFKNKVSNMANTFYVVKLRATCDRDFTDAEGQAMNDAAMDIAGQLRWRLEQRLRETFHDDKIFVKIEV